MFARSSGSFQQRYLLTGANNNPDTLDSTLSLPFHQASRRSVTPSDGRDYSDPTQFMRSPSPASMVSVASAAPKIGRAHV
mgnify:FL=1